MSTPLRLGISTCPNDTFAFHALMHGQIDTMASRSRSSFWMWRS